MYMRNSINGEMDERPSDVGHNLRQTTDTDGAAISPMDPNLDVFCWGFSYAKDPSHYVWNHGNPNEDPVHHHLLLRSSARVLS